MLVPQRKDVSILLQVSFKEFCSINKRLPITDEDWAEIKNATRNLYNFGDSLYQEMEKDAEEEKNNKPPF